MDCFNPKIQQTKMLVTCQRFGDWFLFGLVWQYSLIQKNIIKVGAKLWMLTCSYHITLSLPFYAKTSTEMKVWYNRKSGKVKSTFVIKYPWWNVCAEMSLAKMFVAKICLRCQKYFRTLRFSQHLISKANSKIMGKL